MPCFSVSPAEDPARHVTLGLGDAVLFRGLRGFRVEGLGFRV